MTYTGGELNELNGKMGISSPSGSVPVMKLIKIHQPKSKEALVDLITYHKINKCNCGVVSTGTVIEFGERLYKSQKEYWGAYKYSLAECIQWEYDLFIVQSLKGGVMEKEAMYNLELLLNNYVFEEAEGYLDDELRIDIVVYNDVNIVIGGIQVKPKTFKNMRSEVLFMQKKQNKKWGKPVWMLYYKKDLSFENLKEVVNQIKNI
jgi:hypothetical protein